MKICPSGKEKSLETGCVKDSPEAEGDRVVDGISEAEGDQADTPAEDDNIIIQMR